MDINEGEQDSDMEGIDPDFRVSLLLQEALVRMNDVREPLRAIAESPGRHCFIAMTELEKVIAYWDYYVVRHSFWSGVSVAEFLNAAAKE